MLVVGMFLATFTLGFGAVDNNASVPTAQPAKLESSQVIVTQKNALSAKELAKYKQLAQASKEKTQKQAAGAGVDTTTMVIIGVVVVIVVVALASGGGSGGGGGSGY